MQQPEKTIYLGVTGLIGSGKTTVCKLLQDLGATVVHCDEQAKWMLVKSNKIKHKVIQLLGEKSYQDNIPNYSYISQKVFRDNTENLQKLNQIIHPPLKKWIQQKKKQSHGKIKLFVIESALLFESSFDSLIHYTLLVKSSKTSQIERLQDSRNLNVQQIESRLKQQKSLVFLEKKCQFTITNDDSLENLTKQVKHFWNDLIV